jgi:photosystem II stability/assembly factor-like uncharacterized protein
MRKTILLFLLLILSNQISAQCGQYSELISENLRTVRFWDDTNGFAFGGSKLITTNDGGDTWNDFHLPDYETIFINPLIATDVINKQSAIIVGNNGRVLLTNDNGINWNYKSVKYDGRESLTSVDFVDEKIGFIGGFDYTENDLLLFKSTDGGNDWSKVNSNLNTLGIYFSPIELKRINIHFVSNSIGFLWKRYDFFKTTDGGVTWVRVPNPSTGSVLGEGIISVMKQDTNGVLYLSINGGNTNAIRLFKSIDNGGFWTVLDDLMYTHNIGICSTSFDIVENKLYVEQNLGLPNGMELLKYDLTSGSITHLNLDSDVGYFSDISFYDANKGVFLDYGFDSPEFGRKISRTLDGGNTFQTLDSFNNKIRVSNLNILKNNSTTLTASIIDSYSEDHQKKALYLHLSKDNGNSWKQIAKETDNLGKLLIADNSNISYVTYTNGMNYSEGVLLKESTDYGKTWNASKFDFPLNAGQVNVISISALNQNTLIFENPSNFYYSTNKGQTWDFINPPSIQGGTFYNYEIRSLDEIYAWGQMNNWPTEYDYFLYKSSDRGISWDKVVTIPDNDGNDAGVVGNTTYFGSDFAIVSTGGYKYFKVNLLTNTYVAHPLINPNSNVVINEKAMFLLDDNTWVLEGNCGEIGCLKVTHDQGRTWQSRFCQVCSNNWLYDKSNNELIAYMDQDIKIERIIEEIPKDPTIFGNTNSLKDLTEDYFVPIDIYTSTDWELDSGGDIISQQSTKDYTIKVKWNENGQHILKAKRVNSCGESQTYELKINVGALITDENSIATIKVAPNPFNNHLNIVTNEKPDAIYSIEIYSLDGKMIKKEQIQMKTNHFDLLNLNNLSNGIYFLRITDSNDKNQMFKLIKK